MSAAAARPCPASDSRGSPKLPEGRRPLLRCSLLVVLAMGFAAAVAVVVALWTKAVSLVTQPAVMGTSGSPPNLARVDTSYDWCDCRKGVSSVDVWPEGDKSQKVTVQASSVRWMKWSAPVKKVQWVCDGMDDIQHTTLDQPAQWWSLQMVPKDKKGPLYDRCEEPTGRLHWNSWEATRDPASVPYTSNTEGYACFKIPALLHTQRGSLLAFAEARSPNCSDFARTDLVMKRSTDGGLSWSPLTVLAAPEPGAATVCDGPVVVGNAAPVQLTGGSHTGRILLPHTRNNFAVWIAHSDDDGLTWSSPREVPDVVHTDPKGPECGRNMSYFGFDIDNIDIKSLPSIIKFIYKLVWTAGDPYRTERWRSKLSGPWQFIGLGPPAALQLRRGPHRHRVVVPAYHSYVRGLGGGNGSPGQLPISQLYNNFGLGHVMLSDDGGDSWQLGWEGEGPDFGEGGNEGQLVQLANGSLLLNSRSLATGSPQMRIQARSDDGGISFTPTRFVPELPEPFNGCQGSVVSDDDGRQLFFSHPDPARDGALLPAMMRFLEAHGVNLTGRDHLSLWMSVDGGESYFKKLLVDPGVTGYSALQHYVVDGERHLGLLHEQADRPPDTDLSRYIQGGINVVTPTRFVFRELPAAIANGHSEPVLL